MSVLVCNVGWMRNYRGLTDSDPIHGGMGYLQEHNMGHEICNFLPDRGKVFGYVQQPGAMNLERLGAPKGADQLTGVTVIWVAKRPKGPTVVVGWFEDATVYRRYQAHKTGKRERAAYGITHYNVVAPQENATLLPVDARTLEVPRGAGGMGQSLVWYPDTPQGKAFVTRVRALIGGKRPKAMASHRNQQDQLRKAAIEEAAIKAVSSHFEDLGYAVTSVEKDNRGWDLEGDIRKNFASHRGQRSVWGDSTDRADAQRVQGVVRAGARLQIGHRDKCPG